MDDNRVWPVVLVAAIIVGASGWAFVTGAGNLPSGPPLPASGHLTYRVTSEELGVDSLLLMDYEDGGLSGSYWWDNNATPDALADLSDDPFFITTLIRVLDGHGRRLDVTDTNTSWGMKSMVRDIEPARGIDAVAVIIDSVGYDTGLTYERNIIGLNYRLNIKLIGTNITSMVDIDPAHGRARDVDVQTYRCVKHSTYAAGGGSGNYSIFEIDRGDHLTVCLNITEYAYIFVTEDQVWEMLEGGYLQYDRSRSLVGNGTLEFIVEEGWFFWYMAPLKDLSGIVHVTYGYE